jgi:exopolysaccharide biosynthesis polyprenyl glycosylphosphotransferase
MSRRKLGLFLGESFFIGVTLVLAARIEMKGYAQVADGWRLIPYPFLWFAYLTSFYIFDLYDPRLKINSFVFAGRFTAALATVMTEGAVFFSVFHVRPNREILTLQLLLTVLFAILWRSLFSWIFRLAVLKKNVVFIGSRQQSEEFRKLVKGMKCDITIVHEADDILNRTMTLPAVHQIVFSPDSLKSADLVKHLADFKLSGVQVVDLPSFVEAFSQKLPLHLIEEDWVLQSSGFDQWQRFLYRRLRRIMDVVAGFAILLAGLPIGLVMAVVIKLTSRGPIFYSQLRVGKNHQLFDLIKFRTMVKNAEEEKPSYATLQDPRITAVGKFLRRTRLDELPQALNIIWGDMSFIGPRPERPEWVRQYEGLIPLYPLRFSIKPGLTGWAQVNYPYGDSAQDTLEKLQYDLYYIKNMNLLLDIRIMLKTIRIMLMGKGR